MNLIPTFNGAGKIAQIANGGLKVYIRPDDYLDVPYPIYDNGGVLITNETVISDIIINLQGPPELEIRLNTIYEDAGVYATAVIDGELVEVTPLVTVKSDVLVGNYGEYTVLYELDILNHKSSTSRSVKVAEFNYFAKRTPEYVRENSAFTRQFLERINELYYDFNYEIDQTMYRGESRVLAFEWSAYLQLTNANIATTLVTSSGFVYSCDSSLADPTVFANHPLGKFRGTFNPSTIYIVGDIVKSSGIYYKALTNASMSVPVVGPLWEISLYTPIVDARIWNIDDELTSLISLDLGIPTSVSQYLLKDFDSRVKIVEMWKAYSSTRGTRHGLSSILRFLQGTSPTSNLGYPLWVNSKTYFVGAVVGVTVGPSTEYYEAIRPSTGIDPITHPLYWTNLGESDILIKQIDPEQLVYENPLMMRSSGYDTVDGFKTVVNQNASEWVSTDNYLKGQSVLRNGNEIYVALLDNIDVTPESSNATWMLLYSIDYLNQGDNSEYQISTGSLSLGDESDFDQAYITQAYIDITNNFIPDYINYLSTLSIVSRRHIFNFSMNSFTDTEIDVESSFGIKVENSGVVNQLVFKNLRRDYYNKLKIDLRNATSYYALSIVVTNWTYVESNDTYVANLASPTTVQLNSFAQFYI